MPTPAAFAHGARLLNKDIGLLGEILGDDAAFPPIRDVARSFIDPVLQETAGEDGK